MCVRFRVGDFGGIGFTVCGVRPALAELSLVGGERGETGWTHLRRFGQTMTRRLIERDTNAHIRRMS